MQDYRMETFLTLCETMNHHAAAECLCLTQPAVTQHIRRLEERYGCRLFTYDGRRLRLTRQGEMLREFAVLERQREARLQERLHGGLSLRVGATKTIGEYVIAPQVAACLARPGCSLTLEVDNTAHILGRIDEGKLDFALIEGSFDRARYAWRLFRREPFVGVCGAGHPFAGRRICPEMLRCEQLFLREEGSGTRRILEEVLDAAGLGVNIFGGVATLGSFTLMTGLMAAGAGVTFAYEAVAVENPSLATFQVEGWETTREFNCVWLPGSGGEEAAEAFGV